MLSLPLNLTILKLQQQISELWFTIHVPINPFLVRRSKAHHCCSGAKAQRKLSYMIKYHTNRQWVLDFKLYFSVMLLLIYLLFPLAISGKYLFMLYFMHPHSSSLPIIVSPFPILVSFFKWNYLLRAQTNGIAYLLSCLFFVCFYLMGAAAADLQLSTGYTLVDGNLCTFEL